MGRKAEDYDTIVYREMHMRCACCHTDDRRLQLHLHHIVSRGCKNADDHRNCLMLCSDCHDLHHNVSRGDRQLSLGHILWLKQDEDGECDTAFLAALRHKKNLKEEISEPPQWVFDARRDNGTAGWWVN